MWKTLAVCMGVRLVYLCYMLAADAAFSDYDSSSLLSSGTCDAMDSRLISETAWGGQYQLVQFIKWDAVFFENVSRCGYTFEQFLAFFPGFPAILNMLARKCLPCFDYATAAVLCGLFFNIFCCVCSCALFFSLSKHVLKDSRLAAASTLLYCFTPASVFHTALYTEPLFGLLTLLGLYLLHCKRWPLVAAVAFAASSGVRSNGMLNAGFLLHEGGRALLACRSSGKRGNREVWASAVAIVAQTASAVALTLLPYIAFQLYAYSVFCKGAYATEPRPWCASWPPFAYGFVQKHYWGVGLLKYYRKEQLPNFVLAAPALWLCAAGVASYAYAQPLHSATGGLLAGSARPVWHAATHTTKPHSAAAGSTSVATIEAHGGISKRDSGIVKRKKEKDALDSAFFSGAVAVFVIHWGVCGAVAALVMHVQVATRFLSVCPAFYWYMAHLWQHRRADWIWLYCFTYMAVGGLLHANFYPWT